MKNTKKKGFTIVELVIVIAVIAILAAVAIPTFTSVITKANESAALQQAKAALDNALAEEAGNGNVPQNGTIVVQQNGTFYTFTYTNGALNTTPTKAGSAVGVSFTD